MFQGFIKDKVRGLIDEEREKQQKKFGYQTLGDNLWLSLLIEEIGETAKDMNDNKDFETELVQVAALCVAWLEDLEWRKSKK